MLSHWRALALVFAIASAQATMLSLPSAAPPASGLCQKALQTAEDRLLALETGLESQSEALLALQLTFDRIFQLLNLDVSKLPNGTGFSIDGHENATIIEVVTLGPTGGRGALEETNMDGSGSPGDDEDLARDLEGSGLDGSGLPGDDEDLALDLEGSGLDGSGSPGDDEDLARDLEGSGLDGSGLPGDDEDLARDLEGTSGLPGDDEDLARDLEGSGLSSDDKIW